MVAGIAGVSSSTRYMLLDCNTPVSHQSPTLTLLCINSNLLAGEYFNDSRNTDTC